MLITDNLGMRMGWYHRTDSDDPDRVQLFTWREMDQYNIRQVFNVVLRVEHTI